MSVYRRVRSAPAGSLPSDSAESQDAVQARTERNSEYYQKSRSPLPETITPVPQTSRRLFLKIKTKFCYSIAARYGFLLLECGALNVLISAFQNPLCGAELLVCFCMAMRLYFLSGSKNIQFH